MCLRNALMWEAEFTFQIRCDYREAFFTQCAQTHMLMILMKYR